MHHVDLPCGLKGGGHDSSGLNLWVIKDLITDEERVINLGGKTAKFDALDGIRIHTAGCGGYGSC
jgi:N-methylhydantoinase B/oxoprolinase/acetone carboxylase alpha subunit